MRKRIELASIADVKALEVVDPRASEKYVPIYTSELIKLLEPEFTFSEGLQIVKGSSKHYIDLVSKDNDILRIYNSFDRSMALSVNFISDGMSIPLGLDRLIHIGNKATDFTAEFAEAKGEILDSVKTAKKSAAFLADTVASISSAGELTEAIFQHGSGKNMNKGITEIVNYTDLLLDQNISLKKYITLSIRSFLKGEYTYVKDGVKRNGKKKDAIMKRVKIENRVMALLEEQFPEYFL